MSDENQISISAIPKPAKRITRAASAIPKPSQIAAPVSRYGCKRKSVAQSITNSMDQEQENPNIKRRKTEVTIAEELELPAKTLPVKKPAAKRADLRPSIALKKSSVSKPTVVKPGLSSTRGNVLKNPGKPPVSQPTITKSVPQRTGRTALFASTRENSKNTGSSVIKPTAKPNVGATTKRDPWDIKGKWQDEKARCSRLLEENSALKELVSNFPEELNNLTNEKATLKSTLEITKENLSTTQSQLKRSESENAIIKEKLISLENSNIALKQDLNYERETSEALKTELTLVTNENQKHKALYEERDLTCHDLNSEVEKLRGILSKLEETLRSNEILRRKQHNQILELKGNIRVFCRIRPILKADLDKTTMDHLQIASESTIVVKLPDLNETSSGNKTRNISKPLEFTLDHIFKPSDEQEIIFEEISQLVQSVVDGYNVCIFAYGQTGSGKTFTMEGPASIKDFNVEQNNHLVGVIPRAVKQVFLVAKEMISKGWVYKMETSIVEIYNETINDLLQDTPSNSSTISNQSLHSGLRLGQDKEGFTVVSNLTVFSVTCEDDVFKLMKRARRHRATAATLNNDHSSRSHSVFMFRLTGKNNSTGDTCDGTLNLVDLAGSEKLGEGNLIAEKNKSETININKSLSNLGNVILALSQKADYIPYRNSKLTHLLKNSLGGNSKTLMFVNVSPNLEHFNETINSLRFATKVNNCNIGTATKIR